MVTRASLCNNGDALKPLGLKLPMIKKGSRLLRPYGMEARRKHVTPFNTEFLREHGKVLYHGLSTGAITPKDARATREYMKYIHKRLLRSTVAQRTSSKCLFASLARERAHTC